MNYYNEIDPFAAQWLQKLMDADRIPKGHIDTRSIEDVTPNELKNYTQCHFFAGIGGWSYALALAGWSDDRPVWTGSCPCQPFSTAGKGGGTTDERHLWPSWFHLIRECQPRVIFGEQVEAAIAHGWLDVVQDDLEGEGYSFAAVGLPAASVGAPHRRQRLWFVADSASERQHRKHSLLWTQEERAGAQAVSETSRRSKASGVALGNTDDKGLEGWALSECQRNNEQSTWSSSVLLSCSDGVARPTEPELFPLAHGVSNRVGKLRGYGNAIVPQVAAEVIMAYMTPPAKDEQ